MNATDKLVCIFVANTAFEAEVVRAKLEANGIDAVVRDTTGVANVSSPYAPGNFNVLVLESDKATAEELACDC